MEARYKARECYRVWIPARLSENGKRCRRFFATKTEAEKFILQTKRQGSVQLAELGVEEKHVLGVIRQSEKYEPTLLLEAWRRFEKEGTGENGNLTVQELAEPWLVWCLRIIETTITASSIRGACGRAAGHSSTRPRSRSDTAAQTLDLDFVGAIPSPERFLMSFQPRPARSAFRADATQSEESRRSWHSEKCQCQTE
jgi:hypothetical protein